MTFGSSGLTPLHMGAGPTGSPSVTSRVIEPGALDRPFLTYQWSVSGPATFGPTNLETFTFTRTGLNHRPVASRAGWSLLTIRAEAFDSTGDKVIEFDTSVLVQVEF